MFNESAAEPGTADKLIGLKMADNKKRKMGTAGYPQLVIIGVYFFFLFLFF